tara:strand:+ start:2224 stop:4047 length:1824 start_codon:yes stop_codon:yes gene_type:complete
VSSTLSLLPVDYREINSNSLPYEISSRVFPAVIRIIKFNGAYRPELGTYISNKGSRIFLSAISNMYNWVLDGNRIKPLPHDIANEIKKSLLGKPALSFSDVLSLYRGGLESFQIEFDEEIFAKANYSSSTMGLESPIDGLNATLYPYQESGVSWMARSLDSYGGLILADEMGLGKTIQIIALILLKGVTKSSPVLIACPTTLIANWSREIESFSPSLTYLIHRGSGRTGFYKDLLRSNIVITTYDTLVNDITMFRGIRWGYFICDEAQALKNPDSGRRIAAAQVDSKYVIPVTGTPMENSLLDLWSLSDLAVPGLLGSRDSFTSAFPDSEDGATQLSYFIDPLILKRQVVDVANDLPERADIDIPIDMDSSGVEEYERIRQEAEDNYGRAGALVAISQLSVYCAHPWLRLKDPESNDWVDSVDIGSKKNSTLITQKTELCVGLLKEAKANNKKILIFSIFNSCGPLISRACNDSGVDFGFWSYINGSTPQEDRQDIVDQFTDFDGPSVLVLNPKAAGSGLNITAATVVIHFTQSWNPALEMQASARAHRRGQTMPVMVYRLYYSGTVEETMIERSRWKREIGDLAIPLSSRENEDIDKALKLSPAGS